MSVSRILTRFLSSLGSPQDSWQLFDDLPGVFFFVKDQKGRLITGNAPFLTRLGITDPADLAGSMDELFVPPDIAKGFRRDDQQVISTGKPLKDRLELFYDEQHQLTWFLTAKLPLHARNGSIIGIAGTSRRHQRATPNDPFHSITQVVDFIHEHLDEPLTVPRLCELVNLSERGFHRHVRATLGETPHELVLRIRIQTAAKALSETDETLAQIAFRCGFPDQSYFTKQFHARTGLTPTQFRTQYGR